MPFEYGDILTDDVESIAQAIEATRGTAVALQGLLGGRYALGRWVRYLMSDLSWAGYDSSVVVATTKASGSVGFSRIGQESLHISINSSSNGAYGLTPSANTSGLKMRYPDGIQAIVRDPVDPDMVRSRLGWSALVPVLVYNTAGGAFVNGYVAANQEWLAFSRADGANWVAGALYRIWGEITIEALFPGGQG